MTARNRSWRGRSCTSPSGKTAKRNRKGRDGPLRSGPEPDGQGPSDKQARQQKDGLQIVGILPRGWAPRGPGRLDRQKKKGRGRKAADSQMEKKSQNEKNPCGKSVGRRRNSFPEKAVPKKFDRWGPGEKMGQGRVRSGKSAARDQGPGTRIQTGNV